MALVMADGGQCPLGWGAAAVVVDWTIELNPHRELITIRLNERAGVATAEAVAVLLGLRLLRRCNTDPRNFGTLIVDRPACFPNLRTLVGGGAPSWKEEHYEGVLRTILNDMQRAADDRQLTMMVHIVSREQAVRIIGNRNHMDHDWLPHRRLARAFRNAQRAQRSRDDACVAAVLNETTQRTWRIEVVAYRQEEELQLRVTPNPREELPPRPSRPVPRIPGDGNQDDRD